MFQRARTLPISRSASAAGSASPPHSTVSPGAPLHPASNSSRQVAGVACMTEAPDSAIAAARSRPSDVVAASASWMRAPTVSGSISSSTAMSNDSVVTASSTSSAARPGVSAMLVRKLATHRWGTQTPLGRPVEPDV
jgi:hypothetical protein